MPTPSTTVGLGLHPRRLQGPPLVCVSRTLLCRPAASHVVSADIHPRRRPEHVLCSHPRPLHTNALGVTADVLRQAPPMGGPMSTACPAVTLGRRDGRHSAHRPRRTTLARGTPPVATRGLRTSLLVVQQGGW
ncbi:hypothetical protein AURDEDRAFT_178160 [Auricularia subglabra TFB-10046 SS5]|uniref:Uncharacterized protein n=1 Tax=Auricularia subglabra (strain TFB-10046 / SS5) TaxID=717982 RepID=J0CR60_AURST|nr:hypothetical protein AURDEDRAFT_178160 [Auricularia subglabra TFB-10046 SS5]